MTWFRRNKLDGLWSACIDAARLDLFAACLGGVNIDWTGQHRATWMLTCLDLLTFDNEDVAIEALFYTNNTSLTRPFFGCPHRFFPDKFL